MLKALGQSEYGLYSTVSSTIAMLAVLNLGFNSSYVRYYMKYKVDKDEDSIAKLNGIFVLIFSAIGLIALFCGLFLSFNLDIVFSSGLTSAEYVIARRLMILLSINMAISFPMSIFSNIILAHEKYVFLKLLSLIRNVSSPLLTIPLLLLGYRSTAIVATTILWALIIDISYLIFSKKVLKVKFKFKGFPEGLFKSVFTFSAFIAIHLIVDQINNNVDKVLLGRFCGTESVAIYAVGYSLYHYYMLFSTAISNVFVPRVHKIINETKNDLKKQRENITDLFTKVGRIQYIILALIASGIVFFGRQFIELWAGKDYAQSYYVTVLLVLPVTIDLIQNLGIEIQRALNKHKFRSFAYLFMAIFNVILTIFLCQRYGAVGATIGTAISLIVANGLIMNIYYQKKCNLDVIFFWKNILRLSAGLILPVASGLLINKFLPMTSFITLAAGIAAYSAVYAISMWLFGMNDYERKLITVPVKKILKR